MNIEKTSYGYLLTHKGLECRIDRAGYVSFQCMALDALFSDIDRLRAELAASQAREKVLRTGLRSAFDHIEMASLEASHCNDAARISDALAYRSDDIALRQALKAAKEEMRERAAKVCDKGVGSHDQTDVWNQGYDSASRAHAAAIRSLEVE